MLPLLILLFAATAFAQTTASIQGTVTDQSGAAVVGAKVTVKNTARGIERSTETNATGAYEVPALPPGVSAFKCNSQVLRHSLPKTCRLK